MTQVGPGPQTMARSHDGSSYVEWGAVLAGAVLAAALSFVFLTFAASIGLSATSPWPNSGMSAKTLASLAIFFAMAQQIGSFMIGGYVAGRMRARQQGESDKDEGDFRDGLHGGLVWAVGVVIGAALIFSTAGALAKGTAAAAGSAASGIASSQAMDDVIDGLVRPTVVAQATTAPSPGSPPPAATNASPPARVTGTPADRAEMGRILSASVASGSLTGPNRAYLAQMVAQRAGISQQEAERRVDEAVEQSRKAADTARHASMLTGFVTAASLVISLAATWWAAMRGGNHRDNAIPARFNLSLQRRRTA